MAIIISASVVKDSSRVCTKMIGRLRGEVVEISGGVATIDVAGVGYDVLIPDSVLALIREGETVSLRIRQIVREDSITLYGFLEPFQRRLFDLLLDVKGCGPKIGLALIGQIGEHEVANAILVQDARILARASGVGSKLAERIVLELKSKIQEETLLLKTESQMRGRAVVVGAGDQLIDALIALGYRRPEAESAALQAKDQAESVEDQLKIALRTLAR
jgi:Holliday junction DNA helicase RuvA